MDKSSLHKHFKERSNWSNPSVLNTKLLWNVAKELALEAVGLLLSFHVPIRVEDKIPEGEEELFEEASYW